MNPNQQQKPGFVSTLLPNGEVSTWYNLSDKPPGKLEEEMGSAFKEILEFFSTQPKEFILRVFNQKNLY